MRCLCLLKGLNGPFSLWYDKLRDRLYIGESQGGRGRLIIIDPWKDFNTSN